MYGSIETRLLETLRPFLFVKFHRFRSINRPNRPLEPIFRTVFWEVEVYCRENQYTGC